MKKLIYVMFVIEYTVPHEWTGREQRRLVKENFFGSKRELKEYLRKQFETQEGFEYYERYKGKGTELTYIYRVVFQ